MKVLGVGPMELLAILTIAVLVLGPEGIASMVRKLAALTHEIRGSEFFQAISQSRRAIREMGQEMVSEVDLDEIRRQINEIDFRPEVDEDLARLIRGSGGCDDPSESGSTDHSIGASRRINSRNQGPSN
jgi:Sec-independent protein translocase protein TatA